MAARSASGIVLTVLGAMSGRWWVAGIVGGFATATRFAGILLVPLLVILFFQRDDRPRARVAWVALVPAGLVAFMWHLHRVTGDAFAFLHDGNMQVRGGTGLVIYHHASSAFVAGSEFDKEFERVIAGGWRKQGNHGKRHVFSVAVRKADHPITKGLPPEFVHANDELYQNSVMPADSVVLVTAYSDKALDPKNTGKHEAVVWVASYGKGRVCENVLGHDVAAMKSPGFQTLIVRCAEWAATGDAKSAVPDTLKQSGK